MAIPNSQTIYLLENISSFHNFQTNHSEVIKQLRFIIDYQGQLMNQYLIPTVLYLKRNLELNLKIIGSLNCLVLLYPLLTVSFKNAITEIINIKYPLVDFSQGINKLKQLNQDLIIPYFQIIFLITQWHRLNIQDKCFHEIQKRELEYQLQYLYAYSLYNLQSDSIIEGVCLNKQLLTIYRLSLQNKNIFDSWFISKQVIHKLSVSMFYIVSEFNSIPFEHAKIIFHVVLQLIRYIEQIQCSFEEEVIKQLLRILRKQNNKIRQNKGHYINCLQNGMIGILASDWSLDKEFKWSWLSKILWDLLGLDGEDQLVLIEQLRTTSKQLIRRWELNE